MISDEETFFLSHNREDKDYIRGVAASLRLIGANVWFDEWSIRPGDSIPSAIDEGLRAFETFVLAWSEAAADSRWVHQEMDAALTRWISDDSIRLVPLRLDSTPLPALISNLRYIDARDREAMRVARDLLGIESDTEFRLAVQDFIINAGLSFQEFWGVGVLVACPRCGTEPSRLKTWQATDYERDDEYAGVECSNCGWSDGGEI